MTEKLDSAAEPVEPVHEASGQEVASNAQVHAPGQARLDFGPAEAPAGTEGAHSTDDGNATAGEESPGVPDEETVLDTPPPRTTEDQTDDPTPELWRSAADQLQPLPGELGIPDVALTAARRDRQARGRYALVLLGITVLIVAALSLHRLSSATPTTAEQRPAKVNKDRPAATTTAPRTLDLGAVARPTSSAAAGAGSAASGPRIPGLVPSADERPEPIAVRRTAAGANATPGGGATGSTGTRLPPPEDAPVLLASSRPGAVLPSPPVPAPAAEGAQGAGAALAGTQRNLLAYQEQLRGLVDRLQQQASGRTPGRSEDTDLSASLLPQPPMPFGPRSAAGPFAASTAASPAPGMSPAATRGSAPGLFGGQLAGSSTPRVVASQLSQRSLTLPKGTAFTCALKTRVISATSGLVGCQVQRNVYGDDGRVLLIERGSHLDGEYRITTLRPGTVRIPVLWTRVRTPLGVTVDLDSPGTGQLGESGIDGHVDNRWGERIGAAMLLSLIDDSVKLVIQAQTEGAREGGSTIVLPSTTASTSKLAEKVLDSTIHIPPLIYQNQGGLVGIYVARDVDFSSVYALTLTSPDDTVTRDAPVSGDVR